MTPSPTMKDNTTTTTTTPSPTMKDNTTTTTTTPSPTMDNPTTTTTPSPTMTTTPSFDTKSIKTNFSTHQSKGWLSCPALWKIGIEEKNSFIAMEQHIYKKIFLDNPNNSGKPRHRKWTSSLRQLWFERFLFKWDV